MTLCSPAAQWAKSVLVIVSTELKYPVNGLETHCHGVNTAQKNQILPPLKLLSNSHTALSLATVGLDR